KNLRPGTTNVPAIVGIGRAAELCLVNLAREGERMQELRDRLETALAHSIKGLLINGRSAPRLPNTSSLTFPQLDAYALLLNLPPHLMGTVSACPSRAVEPSHV